MAKLMTSEYDYYSLSKKYYNYIHNNTENFVVISQKENVQKTLVLIKEQVKRSVIEELKQAHKFWEILRKDFIFLFQKNLPKDQNWPEEKITDPQVFIDQFNIYFEKGTKGTLLSEMVEFKKMSINFNKKEETKQKALKKYGENAGAQMERLISLLQEIVKLNDSITRQGDNGQKEKILNGYVTSLATALGSSEGDIKKVITDLRNGSHSTKSVEVLVKKLIKRSSASALGSLLDPTFGYEKTNEVFKNVFKKGFMDQKDFKNKTIVDTVTFSQEVNNETILFGINAKLRRDTKAGSTYVLNGGDQIMQGLKKAGASNRSQSTLIWFRQNILALQNWSRYDAIDKRKWTEKGEERKELTKELQDLYNLERDLATYLFIIRGLDGVYETGQNFDYNSLPSLKMEGKMNRFHSVLLYATGYFIWTVDLLSAIIQELEGKSFSPKVLTGEASYNDSFAGISHKLGKLYGQKMRAREKLLKEKHEEPIRYSAIVANSNVGAHLDGLNKMLKDYELVKNIQINFNYSSLLRRK